MTIANMLVIDSLSNNEVSSDAELIELFTTERGLTEGKAKWWVSQRDIYLNCIDPDSFPTCRQCERKFNTKTLYCRDCETYFKAQVKYQMATGIDTRIISVSHLDEWVQNIDRALECLETNEDISDHYDCKGELAEVSEDIGAVAS